ncbi:MAG: PDZ domain-containing protein [Cyanobacteria bacterium TGS_CYA1]|nr:PDZ domain-containing protein [Cyanobacteria bacterium TGS_CYA1]
MPPRFTNFLLAAILAASLTANPVAAYSLLKYCESNKIDLNPAEVKEVVDYIDNNELKALGPTTVNYLYRLAGYSSYTKSSDDGIELLNHLLKKFQPGSKEAIETKEVIADDHIIKFLKETDIVYSNGDQPTPGLAFGYLMNTSHFQPCDTFLTYVPAEEYIANRKFNLQPGEREKLQAAAKLYKEIIDERIAQKLEYPLDRDYLNLAAVYLWLNDRSNMNTCLELYLKWLLKESKDDFRSYTPKGPLNMMPAYPKHNIRLMLKHLVETTGRGNLVETINALSDEGKRAASARNNFDYPKLYLQIWEFIQQNYYDRTFNHQDWNSWKTKNDGKIEKSVDAHDAIDAMINSLGDRSTRRIYKMDYDDEITHREPQSKAGIGLGVGMNNNNRLTVTQVVDGGPAAVSGAFRVGDEITAIDGTPTLYRHLEDMVKDLRGPAGSIVKITITDGSKDGKTITLERKGLTLTAILNAQVLAGDTGYVCLKSFAKNPARDTQEAVAKLNKCSSIVLDIRLLNELTPESVADIGGIFVGPGKVIAKLQTKDGIKECKTSGEQVFKGKLVVLIDTTTSGAAEALAQGLREYGAATLIGRKTRGLGKQLSLYSLNDSGGLFVTTGKWTSTENVDVGLGVSPDIRVELPKADDKNTGRHWWLQSIESKTDVPKLDDLVLKRSVEFLESGSK